MAHRKIQYTDDHISESSRDMGVHMVHGHNRLCRVGCNTGEYISRCIFPAVYSSWKLELVSENDTIFAIREANYFITYVTVDARFSAVTTTG